MFLDNLNTKGPPFNWELNIPWTLDNSKQGFTDHNASGRSLMYTVHNMRIVYYLDVYVSMDSLTYPLASFNQRYLAEVQDDINVLLEQLKIVS